MRDELKEIMGRTATLEQNLSESTSRLTVLNDKNKQLSNRQYVRFTCLVYCFMKVKKVSIGVVHIASKIIRVATDFWVTELLTRTRK